MEIDRSLVVKVIELLQQSDSELIAFFNYSDPGHIELDFGLMRDKELTHTIFSYATVIAQRVRYLYNNFEAQK